MLMRNRMVLGMLSLCLGVLVFSLQDPLVKAVSGGYPVTEVMAIRAVVALPILIVLVHADVGLRAILSRRFGVLTMRAFIQFTSYTMYYLAIAALPLADAVALYFMAPLCIMVLAGPYLGERVSWQTLATVLIGLLGVVVMLRPGAGLFDWAALLSLGSAVLYGFSQLMARKIGDTESSTVMAFYQNGAYLAGAALVASLFWLAGINHAAHPSLEFLVRPWLWPTLPDFLKMAACGFVASAGMILLSQAYRMAPANRVATFEYTGILWSPLWGFLFFAEVPRSTTVIGAALIIGAGLLALNTGRRKLPVLVAADPA
ncbi:DMT family transporter [Mesorhizobium sp. B2-4-9]|nr:DMT family transporter [Mesorhizobium sp. B2-5-12]TPK23828.1 DMT family transporter [Mesorhizobium sp. B2-5-6]TPK57667.1 DMT family transporter [Mesorhizobium sp. B2-5-1]TPL09320.1 DMT family transporter [Mesorhizobium sp. B2-4-11]TPL20337.1 DMT family transporter [Mesorhizobium sp. B2-4-9]TPM52941.1 DMT family transporter [Mesorhizobium sp. B2-2-3]TPM54677.1 DMT family transporter [Mesorhizobium sp. B2-1-9]TPM81173.1 DMT family transporter [Mesorhizobium sp. B2-1-4]TPN05509.1 DMT family